jgi:hypothetical protein
MNSSLFEHDPSWQTPKAFGEIMRKHGRQVLFIVHGLFQVVNRSFSASSPSPRGAKISTPGV